MITTKEKPLDAAKQTEGLLKGVYTPMQNQNNILTARMKPKNTTTGLITCKKNVPATTSIIVASNSGKRHDSVLRKIENLIQDDDNTHLNFVVSEYKDPTGRILKMYLMDRRSFTILAMGFTGKRAMKWKIAFYDAFEKMERVLLNRQNISWQQARIEGKQSRLELTDAIQRLVDLAKSNGSKNAEKYFISITKMIYKQVFNLKKIPDQFRDSLGKDKLYQLQLVEWKIADWLNDSLESCLDYHEPYREIKKKLKNLVTVIGVINLRRQIAA